MKQPKELFTGVLDDPRKDKKVKEGWNIDEVLALSAPVSWQRKEPVKYPIWNQAQSSACVAFSKAKQVAIASFKKTGAWIDFSPSFIYQKRSNRPTLGMNIANANSIVHHQGTTLEAYMPSQDMNESQIHAVPSTKLGDNIAQAVAGAIVSYVYIPIDIERIAQTLESGKPVSLLIYAQVNEYNEVPTVKTKNLQYANAQIRHQVTATDYFIHPTHGKVLWIDDSWGVTHGIGGNRMITEDFLKQRCILADAIDIFDFNSGKDKPSYDGSVVSLQDCLKHYGTFPLNVNSTGFLGAITYKAVREFQVKENLHPTGVNNVGPRTRERLYELYP